ncbi:EAL domain-containing protein [Paenibacillus alba]|uniref:EAL domain-containing protein n=1 Tax=Paenibacillus alba TaxID=1197127 RepID=UPI001564F81E|nr:EAL domain-containing protein [Paenibacillus alba]NQX68583.1 EAL domain-containing protein [Paenibacillus alba]
MDLWNRYGVIIVSQSNEFRAAVTPVFEKGTRFVVIGAAHHGNEALSCILTGKPDLVIIDLDMPDSEGLIALQLIMSHYPIPVMMLSSHTPEGAVQTIQAMRIGATDYFHTQLLAQESYAGVMTDYFLERCKMAVHNGIQRVYESAIPVDGNKEAAISEALLDKQDTFQRRMDIEFNLRKAIDQQEFHLVYQPVVDIVTKRIVGLESLIRWHSAVLGHVSPSDFIPIAEESGLIHQIGEWVLREACRQNRVWQEAGLPKMFVAVNLSRRQFMDRGLYAMIKTILAETGLQPQYLELEITESLSMGVKLVADTLNQLKMLGIRVAMDDFGTGYSSLSYLKDFPIDKLKIDQSFIKGLKIKQVNAAIVNTVITMARNLNLLVVAEGVETEEELQVLQECGCRFVQGYYFSPPVQAKQIEDILHQEICVI